MSKRSENNKEELMKRFSSTQIIHLKEFGRAVHAEMEAILSAARIVCFSMWMEIALKCGLC